MSLNAKKELIMELQEKMYQLSERIKSLKDNIETEEATKQSFILPFFNS